MVLATASFNPTMVRLLPPIYVADKPNPTMFQSHNGAIAAYGEGYLLKMPLPCFNPTMVRLLLAKT